MYLDIGIIFTLILIIIVLASSYRNERKKAEKWEKDWKFCKDLLDKERAKKENQINL